MRNKVLRHQPEAPANYWRSCDRTWSAKQRCKPDSVARHEIGRQDLHQEGSQGCDRCPGGYVTSFENEGTSMFDPQIRIPTRFMLFSVWRSGPRAAASAAAPAGSTHSFRFRNRIPIASRIAWSGTSTISSTNLLHTSYVYGVAIGGARESAMAETDASVTGCPAAKLRYIVLAPSGSTPNTFVFGERSL